LPALSPRAEQPSRIKRQFRCSLHRSGLSDNQYPNPTECSRRKRANGSGRPEAAAAAVGSKCKTADTTETK